MRSIFTLVFVSTAIFAISQGSISGTVKDSKTGETVVGANVVIQGTTTGASTDIDGNFLISNLPEGTYTLQVSFVTYKTHVIPNVVVETAKRVTLDIQLSEDVSELAEVVVSAKSHTDTDYSLLSTIKMTQVVVSGVSAEQISKTLDRDAAQVVRRIPGVTIRDDQFIVVRGLTERYNAVMLNNAYAPSVETDVRSFSFAGIPSSQLDKILIFKSPAADLPGDFGGGVVKVVTKGTPDENSLVVDYSTQIRLGTTFGDFYHQQRDPAHATGFNTGYYDLSSSIPSNIGNLQQASDRNNVSRQFKNLWTEQKSMAIPDQRFTITSNRTFKIGTMEVGNISALNYSNSYSTFDIQRGDYIQTDGTIAPIFLSKDKQYQQQIRAGLLSNWSFKFNANNLIEFKNLYNQNSSDLFIDRYNAVNSVDINSPNWHNRAFDKIYRGIYSGQLNGTHELFGKKTTIEWLAGYNSSYRTQPDRKLYRAGLAGNGVELLQIQNTVDPNYLGRFYSQLNESAYSGAVSIKHQFNFFEEVLRNPELKVGMFFENKDRTFHARNIGYKQGANFNSNLASLPVGELFETKNLNGNTGIDIGEESAKRNNYVASNRLIAYYVKATIPFTQKLKFDGGLRVEDNTQRLASYDDLSQTPVNVNNPVLRYLPSANLAFNFTEKSLLRAAYGQTLNRPEFRELAPFSFYNFNFNFVYVGNPNLKTAQIHNYDLRYEFYPSKGEMITIGAFYKNFNNAIEITFDTNSQDPRNVNFQNVKSAESYGVELEAKKSMSGITGSTIIDKVDVMLNATWIKSEVNNPNAPGGQDKNRPMQGQAPYALNAALFYNDNATGWQINALYNVVGKSIVFVGNQSFRSVYQMQRGVLDLTFSKQLGERFRVRGGITDILNKPVQFMMDGANSNDKIERKKDLTTQKYRPGQVFSVGVSVKI